MKLDDAKFHATLSDSQILYKQAPDAPVCFKACDYLWTFIVLNQRVLKEKDMLG